MTLTQRAEEIREVEASSFEIDREVPENYETATFSMGCFWGPDALFGSVKGVIRTRVGYAGGQKTEPTYRSLGGHSETIQMDYDPDQITYEQLLEIFWNSHDFTAQRKAQYASHVFYHSEGQKELAEKQLEERSRKNHVETTLEKFETLWLAEDYHQKYYLRQHPETLGALTNHYTTEQLINSKAAMKLNSYYGGHLEVLPEEAADLRTD